MRSREVPSPGLTTGNSSSSPLSGPSGQLPLPQDMQGPSLVRHHPPEPAQFHLLPSKSSWRQVWEQHEGQQSPMCWAERQEILAAIPGSCLAWWRQELGFSSSACNTSSAPERHQHLPGLHSCCRSGFVGISSQCILCLGNGKSR